MTKLARGADRESEQQDQEDNGRNRRIRPVARTHEDVDRERDPHDRRGDEHQESGGDDRPPVPSKKHDGHPDHDDGCAEQAADPKDPRNREVGIFQPWIPFSSICTEIRTSTMTKMTRTARLPMRPSVCDPSIAPASTPNATGAVRIGSI